MHTFIGITFSFTFAETTCKRVSVFLFTEPSYDFMYTHYN
jgi:hypothetical protein